MFHIQNKPEKTSINSPKEDYMFKKRIHLSSVIIIALLIVIALGITLFVIWPDCPEASMAPVKEILVTEECPDCPVCPPADPCYGLETLVIKDGEFPATVTGPAIIEWWDGGPNTAEHEGIFKLNTGETFEYPYHGHYWVFCSQATLDQRYPDHMEEFLAKWPMDKEGRPPTQ